MITEDGWGNGMTRIELTETECQALAETLETSEDQQLRERCQAVLMAGSGSCPYRIAQDLHLNCTAVDAWFKDYQDQGLEGLKIHSAPVESGYMPEDVD
jgi:4-diphosphocytidyl-2C-methyl-D-erythritol kinase